MGEKRLIVHSSYDDELMANYSLINQQVHCSFMRSVDGQLIDVHFQDYDYKRKALRYLKQAHQAFSTKQALTENQLLNYQKLTIELGNVLTEDRRTSLYERIQLAIINPDHYIRKYATDSVKQGLTRSTSLLHLHAWIDGMIEYGIAVVLPDQGTLGDAILHIITIPAINQLAVKPEDFGTHLRLGRKLFRFHTDILSVNPLLVRSQGIRLITAHIYSSEEVLYFISADKLNIINSLSENLQKIGNHNISIYG